MNPIYTSSLLTAAFAVCGSAAHAQSACQQQVQDLQRQVEQSASADAQLKQRIRQMLTSAAQAPEESCRTAVDEARTQLMAAESGAEPPTRQGQSPTVDQAPAAAQQAQASQAQQPGETTNIRVEQAPANVQVQAPGEQITVQQQPAQVTVEQRPPNVEIVQPEPQVTVQQDEPRVTVQQAQPQVQVRQAEPQVEVRRAEPQVQVRSGAQTAEQAAAQAPQGGAEQSEQEQAAEQRAEGQQRLQAAQQAAEAEREDRESQEAERERSAAALSAEDAQRQAPSNAQRAGQALDQSRARELVGSNALSRDGEDVGEISAIARSRATNEVFAIVDVGGFLGLGERRVPIPIDETQINSDGDLVTQLTREELENIGQYEEDQYITD